MGTIERRRVDLPWKETGRQVTVWEWLTSDKGQLAAAGAAGGLVRWLTLQEKLRNGLVSVAVGCLCSLYLGPAGTPMIEPVVGKLATDPNSAMGVSGFLIGVGGMAVAGFVLDLWQMRRKQLTEGK